MRRALDLDAPIVPGATAAGCRIGQSIDELAVPEGEQWRREPILNYRGQPTGEFIYRSAAVDLWVTQEGIIGQIGVHGSYRGKLFDRVELGMTIDDIERLVGPCEETDEDELSIRGVHGLVFDVAWRPDHSIAEDLDFQAPELRFSPLTWFFVCQEAANP